MKVFNPEKELRKIQYGNKNKIIFGIVALLIIIAIGSSYALYQIRYSKQIIYTKVGPFNKRDVYLAVKVNGEYSDKFPEKTENYAFSGYECDGDATVTFDPDKGIASVNATGPDKCTIKFGPKNINYDMLRTKEGVVVDETNDVNLRYIGKSPANYIWFNCNDYDNLTQETAQTQCEKWQIIGLMNNITIVDEDKKLETANQSLVKIIRVTRIGLLPWDSANKNNWAEASLQKNLNNEYLNEKDDGSWITNTKDVNYNPITSFSKKNMIENVRWNIGAGPAPINIKAQQLYTAERNSLALWDGKIALMYPSDYGYATSGGTTSRSDCLNEYLGTWYNDPFQTECAQKDWLLDNSTSISHSWTLTPYCCNKGPVYAVYASGSVDSNSNIVTYNWLVRPSLYLKSSVKVVSGDGSDEYPYILSF